MNNFHQSVLLKEAVDLLDVRQGLRYIDATLGGGGHSAEIIKRGGVVLGIDQDEDALNFTKEKFKAEIETGKLTLAKANFKDIDKIAHLQNFQNVSGIIFDLGISSFQIDTPKRGFSFLRDGPLDMRMDKDSSLTAEVLVNLLPKQELIELFGNFGQESRSYAISNEIVKARKIKAIKTTDEFLEVIERAYGIKGHHLSDFTKTKIGKKAFQALRIAVNGELESITESLPKAVELLKEKGKVAVITFHSLEDRIVKKSFESFELNGIGKNLTKKPLTASFRELSENSRSKSAKLRVFEKK